MTGMEKVIGRCRSADAGSDYLMRGWGTDEKSSAPHFVFTISTFTALNVLYKWCFKGLENPQKTAKPACNFQKMVYSMSSFRVFNQSQAKESLQ